MQTYKALHVLVVITLYLFAASTNAQISSINFLTHSTSQGVYIDENGEMRGIPHAGRRAFNVEVVREMMSHLDIPAKISDVPFKRGLKLVQENDNYALFNVNRSSERENTVKWVGPIQKSTTHFYQHKDSTVSVNSLSDAKNVDYICVLNGNVHHNYLIKQGFNNLTPNYSYKACLDMLLLNRVKLILVSDISPFLSDSKYRSKLQKTPVLLSSSKGYLAFSKNIPDRIIASWQDSLDLMKKKGTYQALLRKYLLPSE